MADGFVEEGVIAPVRPIESAILVFGVDAPGVPAGLLATRSLEVESPDRIGAELAGLDVAGLEIGRDDGTVALDRSAVVGDALPELIATARSAVAPESETG